MPRPAARARARPRRAPARRPRHTAAATGRRLPKSRPTTLRSPRRTSRASTGSRQARAGGVEAGPASAGAGPRRNCAVTWPTQASSPSAALLIATARRPSCSGRGHQLHGPRRAVVGAAAAPGESSRRPPGRHRWRTGCCAAASSVLEVDRGRHDDPPLHDVLAHEGRRIGGDAATRTPPRRRPAQPRAEQRMAGVAPWRTARPGPARPGTSSARAGTDRSAASTTARPQPVDTRASRRRTPAR